MSLQVRGYDRHTLIYGKITLSFIGAANLTPINSKNNS